MERAGLLLARAQSAPRGAGRSRRRAASRATTRPSARCRESATTPPRPSPASPSGCRMRCSTATCCGWWRGSRTMRPISASRAHPRALPRDRAVLARPARSRPVQPGADGTGRDRLPAAQSAMPGLPAGGCCRARQQGTRRKLPVKLRKTEPVQIEGVLLLVRQDGPDPAASERAVGAAAWPASGICPRAEHLPSAQAGSASGEFRHTITHHHYRWAVYEAALSGTKAIGAPRSTGSKPHSLRRSRSPRPRAKALQLAGIL